MKYPIPKPRPGMTVQTMGAPVQNAQAQSPQMGLMDRLAMASPALLQMGAGLMGGRTGSQQLAMGAQGLGQGVQGIADKRAATAQKNKSLEWLKTTNPEIAAAVEAGLPMVEGMKMAMTKQKAEKPTSAMQEYKFAQGQGFDGSFMDYKAANKGGVNINMPGAPKVGSIPQGYQLIGDQQTGYRYEPVPGGPEDTTKFDKAKATQEAQKATVARTAIANIRNKTKGGFWDGNILPETGIVGNRLAAMGLNQEAADVKSQLQTLQSVVSFDRLQAMREASPTGGALGAVSERELALLQSSLGALNQEMSEEDLLKTLDFIDGVMKKFEAYPQSGGGDEIDSLIDQYAD